MKLSLTKDERAALMMAAAAGELDTARIPRIEKELNNSPSSPDAYQRARRLLPDTFEIPDERVDDCVKKKILAKRARDTAEGRPEPAACAKSTGKNQ